MITCDKCGLPIESKKDSAVHLSVEAGEYKPIALLVCTDRHIRCSPSRAQYITQLVPPVIDDRPQFDKRKQPESKVLELTCFFSSAYERLQAS